MIRTEKPEYERVGTAESRSPFVFHQAKRFSFDDSGHLRFHEEMEIKRILSGTLTVNLGSQIISAEAGDIVIVNPYEYHSNLVECGEVVYDMLCVDLSEKFMGGLLSDIFLPYREGKFRFENLIRDEAVLARAGELFSALREGEELLCALGRFSLFFAALSPYKAEISPLFGKSYSARQREFVYKTFSYIHEHYAESIRLSDLAGRSFMTEAHFSRTFKALMGEPPIVYINRYRINRAVLLMASTELSAKEIAERVGFSDEAYFSRAFKKYKGESPTAFLRSGREH
jgi:AraC-like DNA-binding protein/mannose-6-phosphate isomerase-like protein (cupin superfamily)